MIEIIKEGVFLLDNDDLVSENLSEIARSNAFEGTMAFQLLSKHNINGDNKHLKIKFDALASHDITYVGIVQTARASGLDVFPVPYVLTNCHNSLCAVGGTINEDDHLFGLSAAQKYGGIYVPAHQAVIHQYMREEIAGCGKMILGSDSHTRYGPLGTMAIGEGGPELVKQIVRKTYDMDYPEVIAVYLKGRPSHGVGPQDVALALIKTVFNDGFVKNKVLEFVGPGITNLSIDYRNGIDVMTTETTCLSSIWITDEKVKSYLEVHGRPDDYKELKPKQVAYYDGAIVIDLDKMVPMIAMPFHPSHVYTIKECQENMMDIIEVIEKEEQALFGNKDNALSLRHKIHAGRLKVDQAIVAGCSGGTYENIGLMAAMLKNKSIGSEAFSLSVYPASQPIYFQLNRQNYTNDLLMAGVTMKTAFCGPCFGAGDVPSHQGFSIRHTTRNFPNREGSKPSDGQISYVALMDARSIAATSIAQGYLTGADEIEYEEKVVDYHYEASIYQHRVYQGFGNPKQQDLKYGPNIKDWPEMIPLTKHILLSVGSVIKDAVTTTDELIPSGETSSYRSNPEKLAEFTLSRKDPHYVGRAKKIRGLEYQRRKVLKGEEPTEELKQLWNNVVGVVDQQVGFNEVTIGSVIKAVKPGDGSAREQAASCQKVLGGIANIAKEYATKRYRSNCINWGIIPFELKEDMALQESDWIWIPRIQQNIAEGKEIVQVFVIKANGNIEEASLKLPHLSDQDRAILLAGCLMNYYKQESNLH